MFDGLRGAHGGASGTCVDAAMERPERERYQAWHACIEDDGETHTALPLGNYRAPREGWLVVRGRRGHYAFCDEVRAYDLATGAAYIARSCSGLALVEGGGVDGDVTDAAREDGTLVGRVPVDALREAAWMMLLADEVEHDVRAGGFAPYIPEGIDIVLPETKPFTGHSRGHSHSTDQTRLYWSWSLKGATVDAGELTWPSDYNDAARDHAVRLLDIAEAGFVAGCAPARLPAPRTLLGKPPPESLDDEEDEDANEDAVPKQARLMLALGRLRTGARCLGRRR